MTSKENWERACTMVENSTEKLWDMWLVGLGSMSWTQEQVENMVKKYLEQRKITREESVKLIEELMTQAKKNQLQLQKMIGEALNSSLQNVDSPGFKYFEDLNKKVEDLSKKVNDL